MPDGKETPKDPRKPGLVEEQPEQPTESLSEQENDKEEEE